MTARYKNKTPLHLTLCLAAAVFTGCSTTRNVTLLPVEPDGARPEAAALYTDVMLELMELDGVPVKRPGSGLPVKTSYRYWIPAGDHVLTVRYSAIDSELNDADGDFEKIKTDPVQIRQTFIAGQAYGLQYEEPARDGTVRVWLEERGPEDAMPPAPVVPVEAPASGVSIEVVSDHPAGDLPEKAVEKSAPAPDSVTSDGAEIEWIQSVYERASEEEKKAFKAWMERQ